PSAQAIAAASSHHRRATVCAPCDRAGVMRPECARSRPASRLLADAHAIPDPLQAVAAVDGDDTARVAGAKPGVVFDVRAIRAAPATAPGQALAFGDLTVARPVAVLRP